MALPLTLRQIRYVSAVAATGSISAASQACRIAQSSVIAAIDVAEREMGARLFDRRPARGVVVTPAGERFLAAARTLLAAEVEFERTMQGFAEGMPSSIRIGCFEPFGAIFMPSFIRCFAENRTVEIQLFEGEQPQLLEWLSSGTVDVIVTYDVGIDLPSDAIPIARVPAHALLPANDPLALQEAVRLSDLAKRPLVLLDHPHTSAWLLALFDIVAERPRVAFRSRSYESVRAAVACGFGVAVLNMRPIGPGCVDAPALVRRPLLDDLAELTLVVADVYGQNKPRYIRAFADTARQFFREVGPEGFAVALPERRAGLLAP